MMDELPYQLLKNIQLTSKINSFHAFTMTDSG